MARLILTALMMWALAFAGTDCGSAKAPGPQAREATKDESSVVPAVVLTDKQPRSSWGVKADELASDAEVLEVSITKVVNPGMTPVSIFVYLANIEKAKTDEEATMVGNFSLYPPDRPGKFLLSAASAVRKVSSAAAKSSQADEVRLVFEMKRVDETKAWTPIELTIAQPKWRAAKK